MKALSINPFNLKPQVKRLFRKPQHVEIPIEFDYKFQNKLIDLQSSLDYMATNYGINFKFISIPFHLPPIFGDKEKDLSIDYVKCFNNGKTSFCDVIHTERDDDADVARNIYMAVSEVLESKKQADNELYGVTTQGITKILKPTLKIYSGLLEYYAKKYDGMKFTVTGINGDNSVVDTPPPHILINCKYNSKEADAIIYKVDHAAHSSKANAFYTEWGYNLNDFYEDQSYKKIHQMVSDVLKGENNDNFKYKSAKLETASKKNPKTFTQTKTCRNT